MNNSISIVASYTAEPIAESLDFLFERIGLPYVVNFAPYGQVFQQLLDREGVFGNDQSVCNVMLLRLEDLLSTSSYSNDSIDTLQSLISQLAGDFVDAISVYCRFSKTPLLLIVTPSQNNAIQACSRTFLKEIASATADFSQVVIRDFDSISSLYTVPGVFDQASERYGHVPYTSEAFAALACYVCRYAVTINSPEKKVIVLDCDNTLWSGVCGEDGYDGVRVYGGYLQLQAFMLEQYAMGRLLCLASKNTQADVERVFENNKSMLIKPDQLVAWRINWQPKSHNLKALSKELNLGLDSFVFIDDNPVEIAQVRSECPQVLALQLPDDEQKIQDFLNHIWAFDKHQITSEDRQRTKTYQDNARRQELQRETGSLQAFLKKLELQIDISPLSDETRSRAAQLTQRTNQFNTVTRRLDEAALLDFINDQKNSGFAVHVKDRFGDYGHVGVVLARSIDDRLIVTDFMLSCRALGKGVEHKMLAYMAQLALDQGFDRVEVEYKASDRNEPVYLFLDSLLMLPGASKLADKFYFEAYNLARLSLTDLDVAKGFNAVKGASETTRFIEGAASPADLPNAVNNAIEQRIAEVAFEYRSPSLLTAALARNVCPRPELQQAYSKPKDGLEASIAQIWQQTLRLDRVGRNDRYADLGGNSLRLVKMHGLILEKLGIDVPITTLLNYATVSKLAEHLQNNDDSDNRMLAARQRAFKSRAARNSIRRRGLSTASRAAKNL